MRAAAADATHSCDRGGPHGSSRADPSVRDSSLDDRAALSPATRSGGAALQRSDASARPPHRVGRRLRRGGEPAGGDRLLPGVELDRLGALDVQVAEEGLVPAGEREPGHRGGDADVDADHAGVEVLLELAGGVAGTGEDARAVAVWALSADGEGFVEVGRADDGEDGAEDLVGGDAHGRVDAVDDGGAEM